MRSAGPAGQTPYHYIGQYYIIGPESAGYQLPQLRIPRHQNLYDSGSTKVIFGIVWWWEIFGRRRIGAVVITPGQAASTWANLPVRKTAILAGAKA